MTDSEKFKYLLYNYLIDGKNCTEAQRSLLFESFVSEIQNLKCNDFRRYFLLAYNQNNKDILNAAKTNIDKAIHYSQFSTKSVFNLIENEENCEFLTLNKEGDEIIETLPLGNIHHQFAKMYFCAGEIYSKLCLFDQALEHCKKYHYYNTFLKSDFSNDTTVPLYVFRALQTTITNQ